MFHTPFIYSCLCDPSTQISPPLNSERLVLRTCLYGMEICFCQSHSLSILVSIMALVKKASSSVEVIKITPEICTQFGLVAGDKLEGKLHAYLPTKNGVGAMIEILIYGDDKDVYSVLTYTGDSMATLSTKLGGEVELTYRGVNGVYANFSAKLLK